MHRLEEGPARAGVGAPACRAAASATGPTARATSASSTSRAAISWSASTPRPAGRSSDFGVNGVVDLRKDDDQHARSRSNADIAWNGAPVVAKNVVIVGAAHRAGIGAAQQGEHQGLHPRLRRAHRQAAVDLPHHSAARRIRQRHVAERLVVVHRPHRRVDADDRRRGTRHRLPADRDPDRRLLRRPSSRQQPVRREPRRRRTADRQAPLALPVRPPSDLGLRHAVRADPGGHHGERQARSRRSRSRPSRASCSCSIA